MFLNIEKLFFFQSYYLNNFYKVGAWSLPLFILKVQSISVQSLLTDSPGAITDVQLPTSHPSHIAECPVSLSLSHFIAVHIH